MPGHKVSLTISPLFLKVLATWTLVVSLSLEVGEKKKKKRGQRITEGEKKEVLESIKESAHKARHRYLETQEINVLKASLDPFIHLLAQSLGSWHWEGEWIFIA